MNRFRTVAVLILVWNLVGLAANIVQARADPAAMAQTDPVTAEAFLTMPGWAWGGYTLAVVAGTGGAMFLLARRTWAIPLFALSLVGIVLQFSWAFAVFGMIARKGPATAAFPLLIFLIAIGQLIYARDRAGVGELR